MTERTVEQDATGIDTGVSMDRKFFACRVEAVMDRLYGTALRLTRKREDAEDVVAEAVCTAWQRRAELRDADCFEGWLFRILNNTFVSWLRRRRCRQDREVNTQFGDADTDTDSEFSLFARLHQPFLLWWGTPEDEFVNQLLREDIQQALDKLPEDFRIAVVLVEVQGHTYREVAELLDVPVGTVRSRLSRGRALLQHALWKRAQDAGITTGTRRQGDDRGGDTP